MSRAWQTSAGLGLGVVLSAACAHGPSGGGTTDANGQSASPKASVQNEALPRQRLGVTVPRSASEMAPAETSIAKAEGAGKIRGKALADRGDCEGCHADVALSFRGSAHAFASFNNPVYRSSVDRFRADAGEKTSRFCGGCHDIALLVDGAMDKPIEASDSRAFAGVGCRTCHGIEEAFVDGNGSYTLRSAPVVMPVVGDPSSNAAHVATVALKPLRTTSLCASCHRAFLNEGTGNAHHLIGQDDVSPWQQSAYADSRLHLLDEDVAAKDCRGCHMPREQALRGDPGAKNGSIASHSFVGAHTWLASMRGDEALLARTRANLEGSVSIDVAAVIGGDGKRYLPADGAAIAGGERIVMAIALRNERVGHRFPGGTMDAADAWVELEVRDDTGALVAESGLEQEATGDDPTAHRLRALQVGDDGKPRLERQTEQFRAPVFNHTIPPRGAQVVEYGMEVPRNVVFPLRILTRLQHRTRSLPVQRAACEASKTTRGRNFLALPGGLDPCVKQPVTTISKAETWIGPGSTEKHSEITTKPLWRRLFDHGLGMVGALQERRDEALPSLSAALSAANDDSSKAVVMGALAMLSGRQGRVDEAMRFLDEAAKLRPDHPAIPYLRGEALSQVWRFEKAVLPLAEAVEKAPSDDAAWVMLAIARGSAADSEGALSAARKGLVWQPRDHDLLRIQALSLGALNAEPDETDAAWAAWQKVRPADQIPRVKAKCSKDVPGCALERAPVHVHALRMKR